MNTTDTRKYETVAYIDLRNGIKASSVLCSFCRQKLAFTKTSTPLCGCDGAQRWSKGVSVHV